MNIFDEIVNNEEVLVYLQQADKNFKSMGYTEQGLLHAQQTSKVVENILFELGYSNEDIDIAKTAGFLHDIGCCISYSGHAQNGAFISNKILTKIGVPIDKKLAIVSIIGSHEDTEFLPISEMSAAVILADKTDVRRQRVTKTDFKYFDKHDRVHYAVVDNKIQVDNKNRIIKLQLSIDNSICSVLDYFELFFTRVDFCRKAAGKLGLKFEIYINNVKYL